MRPDAQGTRAGNGKGAGRTADAPTPPPTRPSGLRHTLPADLGASLVVFLVAVPLSLGIAVASGAPLIAGIIAAAVGGIVAGSVGGSAVQVSGPAAGLTVIVAGLVHTYGWQVTCLITVLAGVVQLLLGLFRIARAALAVSPAVIHGMLAGVGATIALAQLHIVLGGAPQSSALANIAELPEQVIDNHNPAVAVGLVTIAVMLVWPRLPALGPIQPGRIPPALAAVGAATALGVLTDWPLERVALPDSFTAAWTGPALPQADQVNGIIVAVATVALVASVESLLAAIAVDRMHDGRRVRLDRELTGQGAANVVSGALGGLPVAGVIVRSTANVRAGARTPLAAVLHGVWVIAFVALFAPAVELIPMAALAGLLVFIGLKMINVAHLRDLRRQHEAGVYAVTLCGVVALGLLEGVLIGFGLALVVSLRRLTRVTVLTEDNGGRRHVVVQGSLTFLGVPRVAQTLRAVPTGAHVDLDLHVDFMDHAAFESIHAWRVDHERTGGTVDIDEVHENWYERNSRNAPPLVKTPPRGLARWWAPWGMRGPSSGPSSGPPSAPAAGLGATSGLLAAGAREYHASTTGRMRAVMGRLAHRQRPKALFIACADSRVVPNLITASGPGDLFTLRNIGNLVPRHNPGGGDDSVGAAIEYAVTVLEVPSIVVCGHSHCGAMRALLEGGADSTDDARLGQLGRWLRHAEHGAPADPSTLGQPPTAEAIRHLSQANILRQLENLLSYPSVQRRSAEGRLELTGLYYDLESARVHVLDERGDRFVALHPEQVPGPAGPVPGEARPDPDPDPDGAGAADVAR
ncbi:carbonic anhydrase [Murinocardiopsis flavida]|uniref:carbonic anhydrase n=1 Tax=Murinocardiopsis flavida TaxID=645275 RepID=A0A2P8CC93_9ACTN|nr:bifunctional SulP family inorganic anion transporter/carbonic anhydrase [Murinocardiopsis flavida]PSK82594.1 carbonic anhydrase [Murinocardiopsis flavida]